MARSAARERKTSETRERILAQIPPLKVGVREFRTNIAAYANEGMSLVITRDGRAVGAFLAFQSYNPTGVEDSDSIACGILSAARRLADVVALQGAVRKIPRS
jgi:hypothetical protein